MTRARLAGMSVAVGCVLLALTGCGGGPPPSPAGMNADVQAQLRNDLRILATAAAAHNVPAAQAALAALNADTAAAHAAGKAQREQARSDPGRSGRGSRGSDHRDAESYAHHHPDTHAHPHA